MRRLTLSRRMFLALTGCAFAPPHLSGAAEVPTMLDHILLGTSDLDAGVAFVKEHTGVAPGLRRRPSGARHAQRAAVARRKPSEGLVISCAPLLAAEDPFECHSGADRTF